MEDLVFDIVGSATGMGAYALVLGVLLACGLGLPLPEDVALITGGYLAYKGQADLGWMVVVSFVGILGGDSFIFWLGRLGRRAEGFAPLRRHLTPERIAKVEAQFERRGAAFVALARFLPGIRAATYFVAGGARMPYGRFIVFDGLAALLSAPVFVYLGYRFGGQIGRVVEWARQAHNGLLVLMAAAGLVLLWQWLRARRQSRPVTVAPIEGLRTARRPMSAAPSAASLSRKRTSA